MYCNRCGKPVDDDDRFCRNCGNELKRAIDEAAGERNNTSMTFTSSSNREQSEQDGSESERSKPRRISTDEFVWNIHEFDRPPKRQEEVYVDWSKGQVVEIDLTSETGDAEEQVVDEPIVADVQTAVSQARLHNEEEASVLPSEDIPVTIEDIQKDVEEGNADLKRATARIDKFYTFNQKNEQFQKLLDREYERVHGTVPPDTAEIYLEFERLTNLDYQEDLPEPEEDDPWARAQENKRLEQAEAQAEETVQAKEVFDPVEHIKQATIARQEELAKAGIFENSDLIKKFDTMQLEKDLIDGAPVEEKKDKRFESAVLNELFGEVQKTDVESSAPDDDVPVKEEAGEAEQSDPETPIVAGIATTSEAEALSENTNETKEQEEAGAPIQKKGKGWKYFKRTVIVIATIIILASLTAIGIIELAPESKAAKFVYEEVGPVVEKYPEFVNKAFASVAGLFGSGDDKSAEEKTVDDAVLVAMTPEEIISSQLGNNANIEVIAADINPGYDKSLDYGNQDLNTSVILSQKYASVEEYNALASEIVGTLIKFDSQWIDYVNTKDRAVFDLLKKDSNAYRNCNAFTKAGLVKKEFKELRIGEIRAGADGYYVWAEEKIVTIENGKSSEDNYSWIYYLESVGTDIRVVDYIRDKNQTA